MRFLYAFFLGAALSAPFAAAYTAEPKEGRRNVLFIIADDLNCSLGCYGRKDLKTPNLDAFAATAVRFDRAYVQYPLCSPSRASFLTGLDPHSIGVYNNSESFREMHPDVVTLPQLFRESGYFTAAFGKVFHRGVPQEESMADPQSWDLLVSIAGDPKGTQGDGRDLLPEVRRFAYKWIAADGEDGLQVDAKIAKRTIEFLEDQGNKPFFLAVGFHRPHVPLQCPRKYFDLYSLESMEVPPASPGSTPAFAIPHNEPGEGIASWSEADRKEFLRGYYACVSFVDGQVGQLLSALQRLHLDDNTIVVVLGDHGFHLGEHGWFGKGTLFEESLHAPLLIRAPGAKGNGSASEALVEFVDLYPTLADLCGLTPPQELAGESLSALLENPFQMGKVAARSMIRRGKEAVGQSIRTDRWRYTEWNEGALGVELYDFETDSHGIDRSTDDLYAKTRGELSELLRKIAWHE
ncbi:MAG TPA: sulfatase [bacterium]|nr:sulfatase [bacterium]